MRRVAVTGLGVVSPMGNDVPTFIQQLAAGRSAVATLPEPLAQRLASPVAAPVRFDGAGHFDAPKLRMLDRVSQFALHAASQAVDDAAIEWQRIDTARAGVSIGTGMGGAQTADDAYYTLYAERSERIKPFSVLLAMNNAAASWIGLEYGLRGPNLTYTTACSSSAVAIGEAWRRIRAGEADVMIAGGAEAPLNLGTLKAWEALRTLAIADSSDPSASCRPFSKDRTGLVLGEGAAMLLLEDWQHAVDRGARIHAELVGYGLQTDIAHITRPSIEGQAAAMQAALASADMHPGEIDYINAHGTATAANDAVETAAIKTVFESHAYRLPVSSTKSMHGHLLGAAGALECVATLLAIRTGVVPPTANLRVPDPECDLDYVADGARTGVPVRTAMSNSFAFGGTNAVLIVRAP